MQSCRGRCTHVWTHLWHVAVPMSIQEDCQLEQAPVPSVVVAGLAQHDLRHVGKHGAHAILACTGQRCTAVLQTASTRWGASWLWSCCWFQTTCIGQALPGSGALLPDQQTHTLLQSSPSERCPQPHLNKVTARLMQVSPTRCDATLIHQVLCAENGVTLHTAAAAAIDERPPGSGVAPRHSSSQHCVHPLLWDAADVTQEQLSAALLPARSRGQLRSRLGLRSRLEVGSAGAPPAPARRWSASRCAAGLCGRLLWGCCVLWGVWQQGEVRVEHGVCQAPPPSMLQTQLRPGQPCGQGLAGWQAGSGAWARGQPPPA